MSGRLRADLHPNFKGHPLLRKVREELSKRNPDDLAHMLFDLVGDHEALAKYCEKEGIPISSVNHYWHKGKQFSVFSKTRPINYFDVRDDIIAEMKEYAPVYQPITREEKNDPHLLVIDPSDVHIGKLSTVFETGDEYDIDIAVKRVLEGVRGLINESSHKNIEKILFIGGNDILHTDTAKGTTTSGTSLDTAGMWHTNFIEGRKLYVKVIELLLQVADVHVLFNPSNHDFLTGFFLCDTIASWFRNNDNVTFDVDMRHRKYFKYHDNLIGSTHGDGAKQADLPLLMANECRFWSETPKRYIYGHHVHHKTSKDYIGVTYETLRSSSGTDGWHCRKGFTGVPKAIEGFIHHPINGQVSRLTHYF